MTSRLLPSLALILLIYGSAFAQTTPADKLAEQPALQLQAGGPRLNVFEHLYIADGHFSRSILDDADFRYQAEMMPIEAVARSEDGGLDGPVWARLRIRNAETDPSQWRLDTFPGWGVLLNAYVIRGDQPPTQILANNWADGGFDQRFPSTRRPASAPIDLAPGETVDVWLEFPYGVIPAEDLWLIDEAAFENAHLADATFVTFVFGFRLALAAAIFAFAAILRSRLALYYGLFSTALTLFFVNGSGYVYAYILKDTTSGAVFYVCTGLTILVVFGLMIQENINARKLYPRYNAVLLGTLALGIAAGVVTTIWLVSVEGTYLQAGCVTLFAATALYGAYIAVRDRHPGARQFFLATVVLFSIVVLGLLSWPPFYLIDIETMYDLQLTGFTVDALLFASALVSRAIEMRRTRDAATAAELRAVSERAAIAEQLAASRDDHAEALDLAEARRRQLATTSHDLTQPLVSLQMSLKKLEGAEAVSEGISFLEDVLRRNLDDTRPDTATTRASSEHAGPMSFPLDKTLRNVAVMFEDEAQAKGVELRYVPTSVTVVCEPVALMRIVVNLVSNAIQHSKGGKVVIGARFGIGSVRLQVVDNGAGMTPAETERIFAPHVSGSRSKGEGLGLSVVKTLAEDQGLSISVQSQPGAGSMFTVGGIKRDVT